MARAFGPFALERKLGQGGMAEVYLAHRRDDPERRPLVVKRLRPELGADPEYQRRMLLEAQIAQRCAHENLVRMFEFGLVGDCHYLALEYVRGTSLARLIEGVEAGGTRPSLAAALALAIGILRGVACMHEATDEAGKPRPLLHRDITANNVIVAEDGRPVLIDFGIAKDLMGPSITRVGRILGTARYMAPEHREGRSLDPRSDVFSAAYVAFELLAGRPPWPPLPPAREILRTLFDPPELDADLRARVPAEVLEVVLSGLEQDPERRFPRARDMLSALEATAAAVGLDPADPYTSVRAWLRSPPAPPDEEVIEAGALVVDHPVAERELRDAGLEWTRHGRIRAENHPSLPPGAMERLVRPPAEVLPVPPLPPRRNSFSAEPAPLAPPGFLRRHLVAIGGALAVFGLVAVILWLR